MARRSTRVAFALVLGAAWCLTPACRSAFPRGALDPQTTNTSAGDGGWPTPPQPPANETGDAGAAGALDTPAAIERSAEAPATGDPAVKESAAEKTADEKTHADAHEPGTPPDQPAPRSDAPAELPVGAEGKSGEQAVPPASGAPATPLPDEAQVGELLKRYYEDFETGEWSRMRQHFWPDATLVTIRSPGLGAPPAVVVMSIGDHIARHANGGGRGSTLRIELDSRRIESVGSIASAITHYRAIDTSGQEAQSWNGADLFSFVRHDGQWRIASLVFEGARFGSK